MSKLARKPFAIPTGVTVTTADGVLTVKGPKGTLTVSVLPSVSVKVEGSSVQFSGTGANAQERANLGTSAAHLRNAIEGVTTGFMKTLEIEGIGFKASLDGKALMLSVGFTHPVRFEPPAGVTVAVEKSLIKLSGIDRTLVGQAAATIRAVKKPEPYKGKGIHYLGEIIRRKAGKKVAGAGTETK